MHRAEAADGEAREQVAAVRQVHEKPVVLFRVRLGVGVGVGVKLGLVRVRAGIRVGVRARPG